MAKKDQNDGSFGEETEAEDQVAGAQFEDEDAGLVVNLSEVEEQKFEVIPKQTVDIIVKDNQFSMSKSSGKPMWSLQLSITTEGDYKGRVLFDIFSFSPGALPGTKARLAVIAPELLSDDFRVNDPEIVASLIGRRAQVKIGIQPKSEEYDERNTIKKWMAPSGDAAFIS